MAATMSSTSLATLSSLNSTFSTGASLRNTAEIAPKVSLAPRNVCRVVSVRASSEEAQPKKAAVIFSGALGAMAAVAVGLSGPVLAAEGPGVPVERTAEKADELLKAADSLTSQESPQRFGPGRVSSSDDKSGVLAQQAGAGANPSFQGLQDSIKTGTESAKDAVSSATGFANQASSGASDVASKATGAADKASSGASDLASKATGASSGASDLASKASGILDQASSGASDVVTKTSDTVDEKKGGLFGFLQNITGQASSAADEAQLKPGSSLEEAKTKLTK